MTDAEFGSVEVDRQTLLLGVDVCLAGAVFQSGFHLSGADLRYIATVDIIDKAKIARRAVALRLYLRAHLQTPVGLVVESQTLTVVEVHLLHLLYTKRHEHVVLVVQEVFVGGRHHVARSFKDDVTLGKFKRNILLAVERVGKFR